MACYFRSQKSQSLVRKQPEARWFIPRNRPYHNRFSYQWVTQLILHKIFFEMSGASLCVGLQGLLY
jgi:hypothetical protein